MQNLVFALWTVNGENEYEVETGEFDPIKHHNRYCPWVNGNVAAAGCNSDSGSSSSNSEVHCGWELTLDALDNFQSLGHVPNQMMQSESAASLYKVNSSVSINYLYSHNFYRSYFLSCSSFSMNIGRVLPVFSWVWHDTDVNA